MPQKIILVEDESAIRRMMTMMLKRSGFDVESFAAAEPAWEWIESSSMEFVLISDQELPRMYGLELARKVKEKDASIPVILMTGYADRDVEEHVDVILEKPIARVENLITAIAEAVAIVAADRP